MSRVFALHCDNTESFFIAATWWSSAANLYHQTNNDHFAQVSIDATLDSLRRFVSSGKSLEEEDLEKLESIATVIDTLPDSFSSQKRGIKKCIKEIKSKLISSGR